MTAPASMRAALCAALGEQAQRDPRLMAVSADGQLIFRDLIGVAANRHVDVGIAEGCLVGVAAGLARSGRPVVISSIAAFLMRRAYEQIVLDVVLDGLPVTMIGIGGGLAYGVLGPTHHVAEDIALMRLHPGVAVFAPADAAGAREALEAALASGGPAYIRVSSAEEPVIEAATSEPCTRPRIRREGAAATVVSYGACLRQSLLAATTLAAEGLCVRVVEVAQLNPLELTDLAQTLLPKAPLLVVEEHAPVGGLAAVAREAGLLAGCGGFRAMAVDGRYPPVAERDELLAFYGLDAAEIQREIQSLVRPN